MLVCVIKSGNSNSEVICHFANLFVLMRHFLVARVTLYLLYVPVNHSGFIWVCCCILLNNYTVMATGSTKMQILEVTLGINCFNICIWLRGYLLMEIYYLLIRSGKKNGSIFAKSCLYWNGSQVADNLTLKMDGGPYSPKMLLATCLVLHYLC